MSGARERFLERVRQAVAEGNRAGAIPPLPTRGQVGYQGAGPDPIARFQAELRTAGGYPHVVPDRAQAIAVLLDRVRARQARRVLVGQGGWLDSLNLSAVLEQAGVEVAREANSPEERREAFFAANLGVTGVDYLVAETGSVVLFTRPGQARSLSLLPPVHVALATRAQLLPDLFDLFAICVRDGRPELPACLSLVTGPSKTGDIELRLVTGVHGPGELHVVIVDGPEATGA